MAALKGGKNDEAKSLLERQAVAAENSGNDAAAAGARVMMQQIDMEPSAALNAAALNVAAVAGPERFATIYESISKVGRENELQQGLISKQNAEIAKLISDMNINVLSEVREGAAVGIDLTQLIANDSELKKPLQQLAVMSKK
jgi:hypothetical protein